MKLTDKTRCFNGRVCGMQYQLRITPSTMKSSQSVLPMATNAEMIVFDAFGLIADSFDSGFHYQYDAEYIKKSMREKAQRRVEIPDLKEDSK